MNVIRAASSSAVFRFPVGSKPIPSSISARVIDEMNTLDGSCPSNQLITAGSGFVFIISDITLVSTRIIVQVLRSLVLNVEARERVMANRCRLL